MISNKLIGIVICCLLLIGLIGFAITTSSFEFRITAIIFIAILLICILCLAFTLNKSEEYVKIT